MKKNVLNFVYTGQGSQYAGMFQELTNISEKFPMLKGVFEEASDSLGYDVLKVSEDEEKVNLTEYTQPLLVAYEYAKGFYNELGTGNKAYGLVNFTAGHSLGEYSALLAHGVTNFASTLKAVQKRGQLMQGAVPVGVGAMAALTCKGDGTNFGNKISKVLKNVTSKVNVANFNSENQVVISGLKSEFDKARDALMDSLSDDYKKVRFIPLNVSAPFHSPMMETIEDEFESFIKEVKLFANNTNLRYVYSNFTGSLYDGTEEGFYENLKRQISGSVRWTEIMKKMIGSLEGEDRIVEIGPKPILQGMFRTLGQEIHFNKINKE